MRQYIIMPFMPTIQSKDLFQFLAIAQVLLFPAEIAANVLFSCAVNALAGELHTTGIIFLYVSILFVEVHG